MRKKHLHPMSGDPDTKQSRRDRCKNGLLECKIILAQLQREGQSDADDVVAALNFYRRKLGSI
jgi:hypothetical protein